MEDAFQQQGNHIIALFVIPAQDGIEVVLLLS
jgi:hypothetical protein